MEIQKLAEIIQTILSGDPDINEIHLFFHICWEDCVATVELFWGTDEPDRRYLAIDFDMRRDWTFSVQTWRESTGWELLRDLQQFRPVKALRASLIRIQLRQQVSRHVDRKNPLVETGIASVETSPIRIIEQLHPSVGVRGLPVPLAGLLT